MNLNTILSPNLVLSQMKNITTKKQVLETISSLINETDHDVKYQDILEALQHRERLGSTAIGYGAAIPHARVKNLKYPASIVLTLQHPIDFESTEELCNQPVDIVFSLLVPNDATQEELNILLEIESRLRNQQYRDKLRKAITHHKLFEAAKK